MARHPFGNFFFLSVLYAPVMRMVTPEIKNIFLSYNVTSMEQEGNREWL